MRRILGILIHTCGLSLIAVICAKQAIADSLPFDPRSAFDRAPLASARATARG